MGHNFDTGMVAPHGVGMFGFKELMYRAEAFPQDQSGLPDRFRGVAAQGTGGIPDNHFRFRYTHGQSRVFAQMLVGEKENLFAISPAPFQNLLCIARGADDAAMLAAERLE